MGRGRTTSRQTGRRVLTHSEAELQNVHGSFLLKEVHEAKEKILLIPDGLQLQLQHLQENEERLSKGGDTDSVFSLDNACMYVCLYVCAWWMKTPLTDGFLLLKSAYFCRNGTKADGGSVAVSG